MLIVSVWVSFAGFRELLSQYSIIVNIGELKNLQQHLPKSTIRVVDYDEAPNEKIEWSWNGYNYNFSKWESKKKVERYEMEPAHKK